jgi:hypothetical protein
LEPQVSTPFVVVAHSVVFGVQTPVHAPETHACLVHGAAAIHWPLVPHVSTAVLLVHIVAVGVQTPAHAPEMHAWLMQASGASQFPVESQIWRVLLLAHWVEAGVHTPVHVPEMQAWLAHGVDMLHTPLAVHVCTPLFEHCTFPVVHTPHTPAPLQNPPAHAAAAPH